MEQRDISEPFEQKGGVLFLDLEVRVAEKSCYALLVWNGIFLKDPVTGK
ncbi:hypothetical protein [Methanosphaerula palustris]|uniref:Uncharacterized protein n=1 Tax=Methanosphaerula palustris (strain ATCC BAA-1556 / DSM 19958 / E1-9c) TaxID=521011 RepID=B8GFZ4_METPE|nr:hypothetical protein [Methanosphaerula palustris]ACL18027.1 hypothetical protein Mpal_2771 [Methanosphaerula palustris E1-9c]